MRSQSFSILRTVIPAALILGLSAGSTFGKLKLSDATKIDAICLAEKFSVASQTEFGLAASCLTTLLNSVQVVAPTSLSSHLRYLSSSEDLSFSQVPKIIFSKLPPNIETLPVFEKKAVFFQTLLPSILYANAEIRLERQKIQYLKALCQSKNLSTVTQALSSDVLSATQREFLSNVLQKYSVKSFAGLDLRVQEIPVPLALAQAAIESGWGSSRATKLANNLFGTQNRSGHGLKPLRASENSKRRLYIYASLMASVRHYMKNLNTHAAYNKFRELRAQQKPLAQQIQALSQYSELGIEYSKLILSVIRQNNLQSEDSAILASDSWYSKSSRVVKLRS